MIGVTHNDSTQPGSSVSRNDGDQCSCGVKLDRSGFIDRTLRAGEPHCCSCHSDRHRECEVCSQCLPDGHRWDRRYCSSTCRVNAKAQRDQAELERQVWEAEHPAEAAKQRAEFEAWVEGMKRLAEATGLSKGEGDERFEALRAKAERCAECDRPFEPGDVIYRRPRSAFGGPVLPYCGEHRCGSYRHNRDAPEGRYYPDCGCPGKRGDRRWVEPKPCASCGRLVANDKKADPFRFVRAWRWEGEETLHGARIFCSKDCRRSFFREEAKRRRLEARGGSEHRCEECRERFTARRSGSKYCKSACRQKAYRKRKAAT